MSQAKPNSERPDRHRKVQVGVVLSNKMDKTVVVKVERLGKHARFKKTVTIHKKVKAHDEKNECQIGDQVQLVETRPLSKDKCWRVQKLLRRAAELGT